MPLDRDAALHQLRRVSPARRKEEGERPQHRAPLLIAAGLLASSMASQSLRDSFLVPLLTGNPGARLVVDDFWTPFVNWTSFAMLLAALIAGLVAGAAWHRGQPQAKSAQAHLPLPAAWIALFLGVMVCLGVVVGIGAALSR